MVGQEIGFVATTLVDSDFFDLMLSALLFGKLGEGLLSRALDLVATFFDGDTDVIFFVSLHLSLDAEVLHKLN